MAKNVIVGVDGSETAHAAALKAAALTAGKGRRLYVVCCYGKLEIERIDSGSDQFIFSTEAPAREVAATTMHELTLSHPDLDSVPVARSGKPSEALTDLAAETNADLIVVGNKRVQGPSRVLGSVATGVLRKAPCDVYVAYTHAR